MGGASAIAGFAPVAGDIQDVGQVVTGRDANGNPLSTGDRVITGVAAVVPIVSGPMLRWGAKKLMKGLAKAGQTISAGAAKAGQVISAGAAGAGRAMRAGAVKGLVRRITRGAGEQASKQAAEEATQRVGKETAEHAAKEIAEKTGEQAAKATTPLAERIESSAFTPRTHGSGSVNMERCQTRVRASSRITE